ASAAPGRNSPPPSLQTARPSVHLFAPRTGAGDQQPSRTPVTPRSHRAKDLLRKQNQNRRPRLASAQFPGRDVCAAGGVFHHLPDRATPVGPRPPSVTAKRTVNTYGRRPERASRPRYLFLRSPRRTSFRRCWKPCAVLFGRGALPTRTSKPG